MASQSRPAHSSCTFGSASAIKCVHNHLCGVTALAGTPVTWKTDDKHGRITTFGWSVPMKGGLSSRFHDHQMKERVSRLVWESGTVLTCRQRQTFNSQIHSLTTYTVDRWGKLACRQGGKSWLQGGRGGCGGCVGGLADPAIFLNAYSCSISVFNSHPW